MALKDHATQTQPQQCGCCHAIGIRQLCTLPDDAGMPVTLSLCTVCGALTPNYNAVQHQDNTHQQTSYYENKWSSDTHAEFDKLAEDLRGVVMFYRDKGFLPSSETAPFIIDIGAGRGALIEALRREGYTPSGAEPAQVLVKRAQEYYGIDHTMLQCMAAEDFIAHISRSDKKTDAAFLWHVIEHVNDPIVLLTAISEILTEQGVIILQAPLPLPSSIFPEHLYLLTPKTVFALARLSGLSVAFCDISHQEQFISFVLCKPQSTWPTITFNNQDVLDQWITDLHAAIIDLDRTCAAQKKAIEEHLQTIVQQQYIIEHYRKLLHSPILLAKKLVHVLLTRKFYG